MPSQSPGTGRAWTVSPGRLARPTFAAAVVCAGPLAALHLWLLVAAIHDSAWLATLAGLCVGALAADLVTGLVHWACDTWGSEQTRWIGPSLIRSFREHHSEPLAMLRHDWTLVNGEAAAAACVAFALMASPPAQAALADHPFAYALLWSLVSLGALANQLHQWAHASHPPQWIGALQRRGLVLSRARHAGHHRAPHTDGYCIATGWMNGPLDAARFWRGLERVINGATGAEPRRDAGAGGDRHR